MPYKNPVVSGFYPDPSICRFGEDYYLVNSSFEYFPGVPLSHSRDLVNWRQIGHVLTRESQLPLHKCEASKGVFAPTIRQHAGRFYMVTTNLVGGGNFYVYTDDIRGEWSDPIWVKEAEGIDPSLFFDDDGIAYLTWAHDTPKQARIDIQTGKLTGPVTDFWPGTGGQYPEAPHLYKINGMYYALLAEGGTEYCHMAGVARGPSPFGPWEPCPRNPIITHRSLFSPIQALGHCDLLQAHDGSWWLAALGIRPVPYPPVHHLGRETFMVPVTWKDGWPIVNEGKMLQLEMNVPTLPQHVWPTEPVRDDFDGASLGAQWVFLRNPNAADWTLTQRPGHLRLCGSGVTVNDLDSPAWVGRRQQHFDFQATALLDFSPTRDGDEAGLVALMNDRHHYEIAITQEDGRRQIIVRRKIGSLVAITARQPIDDGPVKLRISGDKRLYTFWCAQDDAPFTAIATGECRYLATEVAGGFTGVMLGMYATGNGQPASAPADFDWFDYEPL